MSYKRDYYISVNDEHVVITKNANTPFEVVAEDINNASIRYTYKVGDRILTPFGIETIKEIIKDYSLQRGYEWLILVKESGNQYKPCELNGVVVKELTLEQWNQIIEQAVHLKSIATRSISSAIEQQTLNLRVTGLNHVWSTLRRNETDI